MNFFPAFKLTVISIAALALVIGSEARAQLRADISPETVNIASGSSITLTVRVHSVASMHAASVLVSFDKSILRFDGSAGGEFLKANPRNYGVFFYEKRIPTTEPDTIRIDQAILGKAYVAGDGDLCTLTFTAIAEGVSPVRILQTDFRDSTNLPMAGQFLHGTVIVGENSNRSPQIISEPRDIAVIGRRYDYQILASDPENDAMEVALLDGPSFLNLDPVTWLVSGTPQKSGRHRVSIRVSDGKGGSSTQSFIMTCAHTEHPPLVPLLISPADNETLPQIGTTLRWSSCRNAASSRGIVYSVRLKSGVIDTTIGDLTDTVLTLDSRILRESRLYSWKVSVTDGIDTVHSDNSFTFNTPSLAATDAYQAVPRENIVSLDCFPTVVGSHASVRLKVSTTSRVDVVVYDAKGRAVIRILEGGVLQPGEYHFGVSASSLSQGMYFITATSNDGATVRPIMVLH